MPNISRSKNNQAMKFDQLIDYNMRNTFLEKSYIKCGKKLVPDLFIKNQNGAYLSASTTWIVIKFVFIICLSWGLPRYIKTKVPNFFKNTKRSGTTLPILLFAWLVKKTFLMLYFIIWPNFISWLPLLTS